MAKVLVVAAHPDDEVLGCGGAMARHVEQGDEVHVLIVAEGATSRSPSSGAGHTAELDMLRRSGRRAAEILGAGEPRFAGLPDNRLDGMCLLDVVKVIEAVVAEIAPDMVYTHHGGDLNVDHRVVHQAVLTACRPLPGESVRAIYAFEVVSSTEWAGPAIGAPFVPNHIIGLSDSHLAAKLAALGAYESEMRPAPHSRSLDHVEALARTRGLSVGLPYAEAFMVIRQVLG